MGKDVEEQTLEICLTASFNPCFNGYMGKDSYPFLVLYA